MLHVSDFLTKNDSDNIMIVQGNRGMSPEEEKLLAFAKKRQNERTQAAAKSAKNANQKKDDFLEGFNDPYGEKKDSSRQSLAQRMVSQFTQPAWQTPMMKTEAPKKTFPFLENSRKNGYGQKETLRSTELQAKPTESKTDDDAFREGFNYYNDKELMFPNTELHAKPKNYGVMFPNTELHAGPSENKSEDDAFLDGFNDPYEDKKTNGEGLKEFASEAVQDAGAHIGLHITAHTQYPWTRYAEPLSPALIGGRITSSSAKVSKHKDTINEVASRYNVPKELIGGIIFKEQLTKSLPDTIANIDTAFIKKRQISFNWVRSHHSENSKSGVGRG